MAPRKQSDVPWFVPNLSIIIVNVVESFRTHNNRRKLETLLGRNLPQK